jgi:hypothetical protein
MNDATLRRRIVVLVIATLLSAMAASATAAVSADGPLHLRCKAPRLGSDRLTRAHSASKQLRQRLTNWRAGAERHSGPTK